MSRKNPHLNPLNTRKQLLVMVAHSFAPPGATDWQFLFLIQKPANQPKDASAHQPQGQR